MEMLHLTKVLPIVLAMNSNNFSLSTAKYYVIIEKYLYIY